MKLRKIRIKEAKNRRKLIWEEVTNSKGIEHFWKATNKLRKKRLGGSGGIEAERFVNHFSKLLGREGERSRNQDLRNNGLDTEIIEDDTEKKNENLSKLKIAKEIKRLRNGKTAGEDRITAEFLKNLTDCWEL